MDDLYREELMHIYKNPSHKGNLDQPNIEVREKNPLCGDEVRLQLKIDEGVVTDAKFDGNACSVSVISSEILLENVKGKKLTELKNLTKDDVVKMTGLNLSTSRVSCASLSLKALQAAIQKYETTN